MTTTRISGAEPSSDPTDLLASEHRHTELDRPAIGLAGHRLSLARRLHSALGRARSDRRRLIPAMVVASLAASITYSGLSSVWPGPTPPSGLTPSPTPTRPTSEGAARPAAGPDTPADHDPGLNPVVIGEDHRLLALDRRAVLLPTAVGHQVEVVALTPTPESVEASVVAESAMVVAVDESVVVIRLSTDEARLAVEAGSVGSLTLLGTG